MTVSFVETMRGSVQDIEGRTHPIDFQIKAEADSLRTFLQTGQTHVTGLIHAAPWAAEAAADGMLTMSLTQRRVAYRVDFRSASEGPLVIEGAKNVRITSLLRTMTHMPVVLYTRGGDALAKGEVVFSLRELPPFVASWLPYPRKAQLALDVQRRAVERRALAGS